MNVHIWAAGLGSLSYDGPRDDIPDEYRELVALIDASDRRAVHGIGYSYVPTFGYVDEAASVVYILLNLWADEE